MNPTDGAHESLKRRKEHILHALYYLLVEHEAGSVPVDHAEIQRHDHGALEALVPEGVVLIEAGTVRLTETGEQLGADIVRRHRLAERLMSDVLGMQPDAGDYIAGEMEHIISPELTGGICTLLGHPSECPHGNVIPPGPCCQEGAMAVETAVVPLSLMRAGQKGTIAYLCGTPGPPRQACRGGGGRGWAGRGQAREGHGPHAVGRHRIAHLTSLGLFPGEEIQVLQISPAFVVRVGGTTLALDADIAACVRVRRTIEGDPTAP